MKTTKILYLRKFEYHSNQLITSKHLQLFPQPLNSSSVWFSSTIMGMTADLTVVQKTVIFTLHRGVSLRSLLKKMAVQSAVSKHIHRKRCRSTRDNRSLQNIVQERPLKRQGQCIKSHHAPTYPGHGLQPSHSSGQATLANQRRRQKCLTWNKEKNNWCIPQWSRVLFFRLKYVSFENQGPRVGRIGAQNQILSKVQSQCSPLPGHFRLHASFSFMEMLISFSSRNWCPFIQSLTFQLNY